MGRELIITSITIIDFKTLIKTFRCKNKSLLKTTGNAYVATEIFVFFSPDFFFERIKIAR